jgi:hypothetical protein
MTVRWKTERPDSGYEVLNYEGRWEPISREAIECELNAGGMVTWKPTGSGR